MPKYKVLYTITEEYEREVEADTWEQACDYVYENDPDRTVPFEQLPEDYLCPACSVEKSWFETQYT